MHSRARTCARAHLEGFDLHAAVAVHADDREGLERLCSYLARPAVAQDRLALLSTGCVRVEVKHPWRDGTTHLDFEPLDFIGRLAAFVPRPRTNIVLYHGVLAPNARLRPAVVRYGRDVSAASHAARKQERPIGRRCETPRAPPAASTAATLN